MLPGFVGGLLSLYDSGFLHRDFTSSNQVTSSPSIENRNGTRPEVNKTESETGKSPRKEEEDMSQ